MIDLEGKQRHGTLPRTEGILENLNRQKAVGNVMLPTACNVVWFFLRVSTYTLLPSPGCRCAHSTP